MKRFTRENPEARSFPKAWHAYLEALGIKENKVLSGLPHCLKFDTDCQFNNHTEKCLEYRDFLLEHTDLQPFEGLYRKWRKQFLSGPHKPSFKYPSMRTLPMPKIFGKDFFECDFEGSVLRLRLDDMPEGEFETFAFEPWPKPKIYDAQPEDSEITSVHVNFVGARARVGFRFKVEHQESRFKITQDEIDELRSRKYPRRKQDKQFLDEARKLLLESFDGNSGSLRVLSVDLGTTGAGIATFMGNRLEKSEPLEVVKIDELYNAPPRDDENRKKDKFKRDKGLRTDHLKRHFEARAEATADITKKRKESEKQQLKEHDLRSETIHVGRMMKDWVRLNASRIIKKAEEYETDLIVFESLRDFKLPGYDKISDDDKKRRFAVFSPGRIRHKVKEKAVERGMRVVTVPDFKSSWVCSACGKVQEDESRWRNNKIKKGIFICEDENCGYKGGPDENAARVLGRVFWDEIQLPVEEQASS
ncbi:MAG: transposase [Candidatus Marinimicrobia bacterium]|nr:transposase [Candidatus Neomarinimicrobiota bacterium]